MRIIDKWESLVISYLDSDCKTEDVYRPFSFHREGWFYFQGVHRLALYTLLYLKFHYVCSGKLGLRLLIKRK